MCVIHLRKIFRWNDLIVWVFEASAMETVHVRAALSPKMMDTTLVYFGNTGLL